jgi:hypothetical protein
MRKVFLAYVPVQEESTPPSPFPVWPSQSPTASSSPDRPPSKSPVDQVQDDHLSLQFQPPPQAQSHSQSLPSTTQYKVTTQTQTPALPQVVSPVQSVSPKLLNSQPLLQPQTPALPQVVSPAPSVSPAQSVSPKLLNPQPLLQPPQEQKYPKFEPVFYMDELPTPSYPKFEPVFY